MKAAVITLLGRYGGKVSYLLIVLWKANPILMNPMIPALPIISTYTGVKRRSSYSHPSQSKHTRQFQLSR